MHYSIEVTGDKRSNGYVPQHVLAGKLGERKFHILAVQCQKQFHPPSNFPGLDHGESNPPPLSLSQTAIPSFQWSEYLKMWALEATGESREPASHD